MFFLLLLLPSLAIRKSTDAPTQLSSPTISSLSVIHQGLNYTFYPDNSLLVSDIRTKERFKIEWELKYNSMRLRAPYSLNENEPAKKIVTQSWDDDRYDIKLEYIFYKHSSVLNLRLQGETIEKLRFKVKLNNPERYPFKYEAKQGSIHMGPFFYDIAGLIESGYHPAVNTTNLEIGFEVHAERFDINPIAVIGKSHGFGDPLHVNYEEKRTELVINGTSVFRNYIVGAWHLDEGSGDRILDSSVSNMDNGTINGATWIQGRRGWALSFDGVDDYVESPDHTSLDIVDKVTVEAWVKTEADVYQWITVKGGRGERNYELLMRPDGRAEFSHITGGVDRIDCLSTTLVNDGNWHHVVGIFMRPSAYLYIDGVYEGDFDYDADLVTNNEGLRIGNVEGYPGEYFWKGVIDEIIIYNRALTEDEIRLLYEAGAGIKFSNLNAGQKIEVYDTASNLLANGIVADDETWISLSQIFDLGGSNNVYFKVYEVDGSLIEETSTFENVWSGSEFTLGYLTSSLRIIPEYWINDRTNVIWLYNLSLTKGSRIDLYVPKAHKLINITLPDETIIPANLSRYSVTPYNSTHNKYEFLLEDIATAGYIKIYIKEFGYVFEIQREKLNIGTSILSLMGIAITLAGIIIAYFLNKRYRFVEVVPKNVKIKS